MTKFYWVISALSPDTVSNQFTHLIRDPGEDPYQTIKDHLISLYSLTDYQRIETLINMPLSGDITQSILMSLMLNLYPKGVKPDFVFSGLFLCQMPSNVLAHQLGLEINDTNALAKKSDSLFQSHQYSAINSFSDNLHTTIHAIHPPSESLPYQYLLHVLLHLFRPFQHSLSLQLGQKILVSCLQHLLVPPDTQR